MEDECIRAKNWARSVPDHVEKDSLLAWCGNWQGTPQTWQLTHPFHWNWRKAQPKWFRPCWTQRITPHILYVLSCLLEELQSGAVLAICAREHSRAPSMTSTCSICAIPIPDPGSWRFGVSAGRSVTLWIPQYPSCLLRFLLPRQYLQISTVVSH